MKPIDFLNAQPDDLLAFEENAATIAVKRSDFYLVDSFLDEAGDVFLVYHAYIQHCKYAEVTLWWESGKMHLAVVVWRVPFSCLSCPANWQDEMLTRIQGLTVNPSQDRGKSDIYVPYMMFSS